VSSKGEPIPNLESERKFGDFDAFWKDISHHFTDEQLCFKNMELFQIAASDE